MYKRIISVFVFSLCVTSVIAQKFIVSPTKLYSEPSTGATHLGILLRGALVNNIEESDINQEFVKVTVDNTSTGYVLKSFIRKTLNASDNYTPSPSPIIENDGIYGSPHMFITVASLRGRLGPSTKTKVGKVFTMGEVARVNYYPYDPEDWVNVGGYFIQQKFLGKRPILEELYKQFDTIPYSNVAERQKIGQRINEFIWNTNVDASKASGLKRCLSVAKQVNDKNLIKKIVLEITIEEEKKNKLSYAELEKIDKEKNFLIINGVKVEGYELTLKELLNIKGSPIKKVKEEDDCCFAGTIRYVYKDAEFMVEETKGVAEIIWLSLKTNAYVVNGFKISSKVTRDQFVKKLARIFYYNGHYPNDYGFYFLDYAGIEVTFKNNRPDKFSFSIYP
ncbi:SH3 domain-containing protein [Tenacibaculum jejuense]|uniref:SH3b domain-containing protein n=1 Tax=Tenacibaculum jejuense TaxID=584609 RepID=A0A238UCK7_9FLAO|nr:SH3 domain-containing protein [Tenacibaculum jejuense]SNR16194.1 Protein of unknown function precursor [Tenacibaculum jejuense]